MRYFGVMDGTRSGIKSLAREASLLPQEELLLAPQRGKELVIGIPKEDSLQEKRVALVPEAVALLVARRGGGNTRAPVGGGCWGAATRWRR